LALQLVHYFTPDKSTLFFDVGWALSRVRSKLSLFQHSQSFLNLFILSV